MAAAESEYDCSVAIARGNISQMVSNVSVIRRLQGMLGTAKDTPEHRSRLHLCIEQTKKLAQDTKALLHRMASMGGYQVFFHERLYWLHIKSSCIRIRETPARGTSSASWATTCSVCSRASGTR